MRLHGKMVRWMLILFCLTAGMGCRLFEKKSTPQPVVQSQRFLGTLSMVNEAGGFVLVDFGGFAAPEPDAELQVRRDGREVARLRAGRQVRRPFAAADILSGTPGVGDDVWTSANLESETVENQENPELTDSP